MTPSAPNPGGKSSVTVRIAGEEHTIRASAEPDYTKSCARFVDERIADIRAKAGLIEGYKAAILAALSITDQYFQLREELDGLRARVGTRAGALADRLEARVADRVEDRPEPVAEEPRASPAVPGDAGTPTAAEGSGHAPDASSRND